MRRFLLFILAVMAFAACTNDSVEEQVAIRHEAPETITVGFEDDDTRIQLNEAQKTVWTKDDLVSVFYRSNANQKWQYQGETGERIAELTRVDAGEATATMNRVVVVYPYNDDYYINTETYNIQAFLPAVQTYLKDSYGLDGNIMISQSEYNQFSLKSVCGWLKLQLTGDGEKVKSITLRGNNGEQVAGELYINSADATVTLSSDTGSTDDGETVGAGGGLVSEDTILKDVTLDCGEGVTLGTEATAFYIALPPQTHTEGITVDITTINGLAMTKSTDKEVVIERNHIQPMTAFTADFHIPETWKIYYTATQKVEPYDKTVFGATYLSNVWDSETGEGVITFDNDVTMIGEDAFRECTSLTSVNIPDSVTSIGDSAFYWCRSLTSVNIPDSVTSIGESAFYYCDSLTSVNIPDSVTTIGSSAFSWCKSLTSVNIPDRVMTIGDYAFNQCTSITSVIIPDSVTSIGDSAFFNCTGLTSINIPDSVTSIGREAFAFCDSLTSVTIPDGVTTIEQGVFSQCRDLKSVTIPDSVTTIGYGAFSNCDHLESVTIPDSVTSIGDYAFSSCNYLTSVYCKATTPPVLSGTYVFDGSQYGRKIYVPYKSVNAYESAKYWSEYADAIVVYHFEEVPSNNEIWYTSSDGNVVKPYSGDKNNYANALNTFGANIISNTCIDNKGVITFDARANKIGNYAFKSCHSLTSVNIPESVIWIRQGAFSGCISLTSVTITDSVTSIGDYAFELCDGLTNVTIPDSVTEIGKYAFQWCNNLKSVTIGNGVTSTGKGTFYECSSLTNVTIGDGVTEIGVSAFENCESLTSVTIPDSVTTIGSVAFRYCKKLTSVYCKATTPPALGNTYVFDNNGSGRKIYVPAGSVDAYKSAEYWSEYADYIVGYDFSTTSIINYTTSDGQIVNARLPIISNTYSNGIGTIEFLGSIIPERAFYDCDNLTSVTIGDSVTTIGEYAFNSCSSLKSVTISDGVTTIGKHAFQYCSSLTSVTIPDSVSTIGGSAFFGCNSLTNVYCKATTPPALGNTYVFDNNGSGRKIYVPYKSVNAYDSAEYWDEYASAIVGYDFENGVVVE